MKQFLKQWFPWLLFAGVALGGTIHTFANGTVLNADDLNQALQHIHNQMVGGHGARLVNADVSTSAAITSSKIVNGVNIPRAWGVTKTICDAGTCSMAASQNITSMVRTATGQYTVTLAYTATDSSYYPNVTSGGDGMQLSECVCNSLNHALSTTAFGIRCFDGNTDGGAPGVKDCNVGFVVYDNN